MTLREWLESGNNIYDEVRVVDCNGHEYTSWSDDDLKYDCAVTNVIALGPTAEVEISFCDEDKLEAMTGSYLNLFSDSTKTDIFILFAEWSSSDMILKETRARKVIESAPDDVEGALKDEFGDECILVKEV